MIRIMLSRKLGELRISQAELSAATGIRPNTINDLYHDVTDRVSLDNLDKICEALNCDLAEIVEYTPNSSKKVRQCSPHGVYKARK